MLASKPCSPSSQGPTQLYHCTCNQGLPPTVTQAQQSAETQAHGLCGQAKRSRSEDGEALQARRVGQVVPCEQGPAARSQEPQLAEQQGAPVNRALQGSREPPQSAGQQEASSVGRAAGSPPLAGQQGAPRLAEHGMLSTPALPPLSPPPHGWGRQGLHTCLSVWPGVTWQGGSTRLHAVADSALPACLAGLPACAVCTVSQLPASHLSGE